MGKPHSHSPLYGAAGEKIDAVTAKEFGLVKEVVEEDRLLERATEVAHSLKGSVRKIVQEGIVDRLLEVNAKVRWVFIMHACRDAEQEKSSLYIFLAFTLLSFDWCLVACRKALLWVKPSWRSLSFG